MKCRYIDVVLWLVASLSVVFAFHQQYFVETDSLVLFAWLSVFASSVLVAMFSTQGRLGLSFFKEARSEIAKVVWPKQHEVMMTTVAVGFAVALFSMLITLLDSMLVKLLAYIK